MKKTYIIAQVVMFTFFGLEETALVASLFTKRQEPGAVLSTQAQEQQLHAKRRSTSNMVPPITQLFTFFQDGGRFSQIS